MADLHNPTPEDVGNLKDFLNLNKELDDILRKQAARKKDLLDLDSSMGKQLEVNHAEERKLLKLQVDKFSELVVQEREMHMADHARQDELKVVIASIKQELQIGGKVLENLQAQMQLDAQRAKAKYEYETRYFQLVKDGFNHQFKFSEKLSGTYSKVFERLKAFPLEIGEATAGLLAGFVAVFEDGFNRFKLWDAEAAKFRNNMGMFRDSASKVRDMVERIAVQFMGVGVTLGDAYSAVTSLGIQMGGVHNVSKKIAETTALFKAQLGVATEDTAEFLRNMAAISHTTMEAQESSALYAHNLAQAAGVPLTAVMKDVAKLSGTTLAMISKYPNIVLRTAIEARKMNTTIADMARASRELLNFNENVTNEMEASVLLGRDIDLQKARQLAYQKDLEGSTKEILRLTKQIDFSNLDPFQMQAFARATGRSEDELLKMVQAEKEMEAARKNPALAKQVADYDRMKSLSGNMLKDENERAKLQLMQSANQDRMAILSNKWNQLLAKATQLLFPLIDGLLLITGYLVDFIPLTMAFAGAFGKGLVFIGNGIEKLIGGSIMFTNAWKAALSYGTTTMTFGQKALVFISKLGMGFASVIGKFGKFVGFFAKWLGPIGLVITAFQGIYGFIQGFKEGGLLGGLRGAFVGIIPFGDKILNIFSGMFSWIGDIASAFVKWFHPIDIAIEAFNNMDAIIQGIKESITGVGEWIVLTFNKAWDGIKDWLGFSPSNLGLRIVQGIASVSAMIFDAITSPFRDAFAWVLDKIPGMGKISEKIKGGVSGILNTPKENQIGPTYVPAIQVTPNGVTPSQAVQQQKEDAKVEKDTSGEEQTKLLTNILNALNTLNENFSSGRIAVSIDGQLLSTVLARTTEFRGGYGTNQA